MFKKVIILFLIAIFLFNLFIVVFADDIYNINLWYSDGGRVTLNNSAAHSKVAVTFIVAADKNYYVDKISVWGEKGEYVQLNQNENAYTFSMPSENVYIEVYFRKDVFADYLFDESRYLNKEEHLVYVTGDIDGYIRPNDYATRAEVTDMLYNVLRTDVRVEFEGTANPFFDVTQSDWFNLPVTTLYNLGIINGYSGNQFKPDDYITRAEFAKIISEIGYGYGDIIPCGFSDIKGHWAEKFIYLVKDFGWMCGYSDGTFKPDNYITRAEVIVVINRMLERDTVTVESFRYNMVVWKDNEDMNMWYYKDIQEASSIHDYYRDNGIEYWAKNFLDI